MQNLVHHHRRRNEPQLATRKSGERISSQSSAIGEKSHLWGRGTHKFTQESIPFHTVRGCSDAGRVHVVNCVRQQMVLRVVRVFFLVCVCVAVRCQMWRFSVVLKWIDLVRHECTNKRRKRIMRRNSTTFKKWGEVFFRKEVEAIVEATPAFGFGRGRIAILSRSFERPQIIRSLKWFLIRAAVSCSHFWRDNPSSKLVGFLALERLFPKKY